MDGVFQLRRGGWASAASAECSESHCDGDVLVECVTTVLGDVERRTDCESSCGTIGRLSSRPICDPCPSSVTAAQSSCVGSEIVACNGLGPVVQDCAEFGYTCVEDPTLGQDPISVDPESSCTSSGCEGAIARHCHQGKAQRIDCSLWSPDLQCMMIDGHPRCIAAESQCSTGTRCDGANAQLCSAGAWFTLPCEDPQTTCEEVEDGATCVPVSVDAGR